ncbi:hypothetical protein SI859A1_01458 [Aurantimonas manganoxydans SI85-9A1]|uniref:Uncharacterized protein n=1 Tax=Aurantimonas manganoxydans (strain ATCC BAA-1229 / DSM 21871 / SI85-9A1) TaxID=287752 RepID=Q1YIL6_AURMS|nr:hypothetical protein SI859A1_01458 [Aurantimonas manganoxydans SI85-9A1]
MPHAVADGPATPRRPAMTDGLAARATVQATTTRNGTSSGAAPHTAADRPCPSRKSCCDVRWEKAGRSERIRTSDPLNPIQVRYQAALRSDCVTPRGRTLSVQQENRRQSAIV